MQITEKQEYGLNTAIGLAGGTAAYAWAPSFINRIYFNYLTGHTEMTKEENSAYWAAGLKAKSIHPLLGDKVTISDMNESNWSSLADDLIKRIDGSEQKENTRRIARRNEKIRERLMYIARGKNASYYTGFSQVYANKEKNAFAVFHELGHAINAKGSGFKNLLSKTRHKAANLVPFVFGISMLIPKDREDKPTDNPAYKTLLNFKKYAGLIASACLLPTVMEEGLASINANKLGKNVLTDELRKKMNKMNFKAFCSYAIAMIFAGVGVTFANYVKDKITGPRPAKQEKSEETAD